MHSAECWVLSEALPPRATSLQFRNLKLACSSVFMPSFLPFFLHAGFHSIVLLLLLRLGLGLRARSGLRFATGNGNGIQPQVGK